MVDKNQIANDVPLFLRSLLRGTDNADPETTYTTFVINPNPSILTNATDPWITVGRTEKDLKRNHIVVEKVPGGEMDEETFNDTVYHEGLQYQIDVFADKLVVGGTTKGGRRNVSNLTDQIMRTLMYHNNKGTFTKEGLIFEDGGLPSFAPAGDADFHNIITFSLRFEETE